MFDLKRPCKDCPFRADVKPYIRKARAVEIGKALLNDKTFTCHKHLPRDGKKEQHCAGALIFLEAQNKPNQLMRVAERLGTYDRRKLDMNAPVFKNIEDFVKHFE